MEIKYKRKYRFHKWYSVIYYDESTQHYYYKEYLTLREAKNFVSALDIIKEEICDVQIVKKIFHYNYYDGRVPIEKL